MEVLALTGGVPVHASGWPTWPRFDAATVAAVTEALTSGRWTVTGAWNGRETYERTFARRFAEFVGVPYAVSTDHGSSSLILALEALGIGAGDEVIVPVLTWVATATAVLNVNAIPVFVDVDPDTGCLRAEDLEAAITDRTKAVIVVHLHCRMADMDAIMAVAKARGLRVVEDCAQAHGARWRGTMAGAFGDIGAFSMQQGKVLTAGEGGAVVTHDAGLYERLQQLRADGCRYPDVAPAPGEPYLVDAGDIMGTNGCLGELQAALLLDQLDRLEPWLETRAASAAFLDGELARIPGVRPLARSPHLQRPSIFEYAVRRIPDAFGAKSTAVVRAALQAELGVRVHEPDRPLHQNVLYCPETKERYRWIAAQARPAAGTRFPAAEELYANLILLPHRVLLADRAALHHVVEAFAKVAAHSEEL
ncbi:MAG: DegT/DnrJ/EryC1/StrS family aminotransferase [Chloroflexi bacterium]|nr:DegT/DnrJ/EryC1/StrS family aminotransferase [Chloroflexota bacterium]